MNQLLKIKSGLVIAILSIEIAIYSPVWANTNQNQQYIEQQQRKQSKKQSTSQQLWESFRRQQDRLRLNQRHRIEQFGLENRLRQQPFRELKIDQLRLQQRQEMEILRLQQKLRNL